MIHDALGAALNSQVASHPMFGICYHFTKLGFD